ncbi:hypothetical protein AVEN_129458-1 [Araneus ventricosus]|uniref:Uncharacterized protein n=1 Tax=Araneus ventricosus TaxID=182803 RepID=A0A4Y2RYK8_ARAVE|nr:hypothetical protein AVEN_129458-1 [Araneus ventricosus]
MRHGVTAAPSGPVLPAMTSKPLQPASVTLTPVPPRVSSPPNASSSCFSLSLSSSSSLRQWEGSELVNRDEQEKPEKEDGRTMDGG